MGKLKPLYCLCCILLVCAATTACIITQTHVKPLDKQKVAESKNFSIGSPTKAHLIDGAVVVYAKGFELRDDIL
ncbi:MAG TPA: hypothetical protein VGA99_12530, partial [bacterium]